MPVVGDAVRSAREARGWGRERLAEEASALNGAPEIDVGYLRWLEVARNHLKENDRRFVAVCKALGLDAGELVRKAVGA